MTKVKMPEPVAYAVKAANTGKICSLYAAGEDAEYSGVFLIEKECVDDLITTTQAEAYKDACVREALEKAEMVCGEQDYISDAARAIRALIPPLSGPVEP